MPYFHASRNDYQIGDFIRVPEGGQSYAFKLSLDLGKEWWGRLPKRNSRSSMSTLSSSQANRQRSGFSLRVWSGGVACLSTKYRTKSRFPVPCSRRRGGIVVNDLPRKEDFGCHAHVAKQRGHAHGSQISIHEVETDSLCSQKHDCSFGPTQRRDPFTARMPTLLRDVGMAPEILLAR